MLEIILKKKQLKIIRNRVKNKHLIMNRKLDSKNHIYSI